MKVWGGGVEGGGALKCRMVDGVKPEWRNIFIYYIYSISKRHGLYPYFYLFIFFLHQTRELNRVKIKNYYKRIT